MLDEKLRVLAAELLDVPVQNVTLDMRRADTENWDSLNHLRLITAVESEFGAALTMEEIAQLQSLADLQRIISSRAPSFG